MTVDVHMTDAHAMKQMEGIPYSEKYRPQSLNDVASHKVRREAVCRVCVFTCLVVCLVECVRV